MFRHLIPFRVLFRLLLTLVVTIVSLIASIGRIFWTPPFERPNLNGRALGLGLPGIVEGQPQNPWGGEGAIATWFGKRVGRSTFRKLYWGPLLGIAFLWVFWVMVLACKRGGPSEPLDNLGLQILGWAFLVWLLLGRPIAHRLVPCFVSSLSCPGCWEEIDAVGVWNCSCGFHDHRERHILASHCPLCGKAAGHVNCPLCGATILLW